MTEQSLDSAYCTRAVGRPLATAKRCAVALGFEFLLPECRGKRQLTRELMVIDSARFPLSISSERGVRRDMAGHHNPVTKLLVGARRLKSECLTEGGASLIESVHRLERVYGRPYLYGHGWHWTEGCEVAVHRNRQLRIDEDTYRLLEESQPITGCVLIIFVPVEK